MSEKAAVIITILLVVILAILVIVLLRQSVVRKYLQRLLYGQKGEESFAILEKSDAGNCNRQNGFTNGSAKHIHDSTYSYNIGPTSDRLELAALESEVSSTSCRSPTRSPVGDRPAAPEIVFEHQQAYRDMGDPAHVIKDHQAKDSPSDAGLALVRRSSSPMSSVAGRMESPSPLRTPDLIRSVHERRFSGVSIASDDSSSEFDEHSIGRLARASSTDSTVDSSSVLDLALSTDQDYGQLEVKLFYDRTSQLLNLWMTQGYKFRASSLHTEFWVVVFLLPHPKPVWRTKFAVNASNPQFHQQFQQSVKEAVMLKLALMCQVYCREQGRIDVVGQTKIRLKDIYLFEPKTLWLHLLPPPDSETKVNLEPLGQIFVVLYYSLVSERLTVVAAKIKELHYQADDSSRAPKDIYVKAYLVHGGNKVSKKRTSVYPYDVGAELIIQESMVFSISQRKAHKAFLRLSITELKRDNQDEITIGHVTLGGRCSDKAFGHWNKMMTNANKPVSMWHSVVPPKRA